ncbi:GNAT family N-acetyltransferase [uncultured Clostridium sp.]|uniref:GNAT family N-acetyltransferase n=1 Tax=uncultured Clostridium sp. TaxID=59620 RepID=UPI00260A4482|nr:GNAT family protein [uncultured Clostridium sp.]
MHKAKSVKILLVTGSKKDYVIKDSTGITVGRFIILELNQDDQRSSIRLKFYRESKALLEESLEKIARVIFNKKDIYKLNIFVTENISVGCFLNVGFVLEGILTNNTISNGVHRDELLFGIDKQSFREGFKMLDLELSGKRLTLKTLNPAYADEMLEYYNNNKEHLHEVEPTRDQSFYSVEVQRNILVENYKQNLNGTALDMGIFIDDEFIGKIKLSNIVYGVFKSAFVGYSIDKDHQGKGYMKESLNLVLEYAFDVMGLHRIEASTLLDNEKSQGVLNACGFIKVGVNQKYLFINGEWRDHITFSKIAE